MCIHVCTYLNVNHPTYNLAPTSLHPSKARVGCWAPEPWRLWFQQSWLQPADDAAPPNMPRRGNDHQDGLNDVWSILDLWVEDLKFELHFPEERWPKEGSRSFFGFFSHRVAWCTRSAGISVKGNHLASFQSQNALRLYSDGGFHASRIFTSASRCFMGALHMRPCLVPKRLTIICEPVQLEHHIDRHLTR